MFISYLLRHGQDIEWWTAIVNTLSWKTMDYIVSALVVKSYFDQRSHHVYCKGCRSKTTLVTWCSHSTGFPIPRSQLLGPLLFLLYIKDLPNSSSLLYFIIFAEYVIFLMSLLILLCIQLGDLRRIEDITALPQRSGWIDLTNVDRSVEHGV